MNPIKLPVTYWQCFGKFDNKYVQYAFVIEF